MFPNEARGLKAITLLAPANASNTAEATGAWTSTSGYVGELVVVQSVGAMGNGTTLNGALETASDENGSNNAAIIPVDGNFVEVTEENNAADANNATQKRCYDLRQSLGYLKYIGTLATDAAFVSVTATVRPKESS